MIREFLKKKSFDSRERENYLCKFDITILLSIFNIKKNQMFLIKSNEILYDFIDYI